MKKVLYNPFNQNYKNPAGCLKPSSICKIIIKLHKSLYPWNLRLCLYKDKNFYQYIKSTYNGSEFDYDIFEINFQIYEPGIYFYSFIYERLGTIYSINNCGANKILINKNENENTISNENSYWQITCTAMDFTAQNAYKGSIMYQIFPDRFFKYGISDISKRPKIWDYYLHSDTNETPQFLPNANGEVLNNDFYGGNLQGIIHKLDYLKTLMIDIIYLNPICLAYSNHRYDTANYKIIDYLLGTDDDFIELCTRAKEKNIKIILDGVFSHTGSRSIYFNKDSAFDTNGAFNNKSSKYYSWYNFSQYPEKYDSWWDINTLACVNETNRDFLNYIIRDPESVINRWIDMGISGIRLDVADELPDEFIKVLHKYAKKKKNDFLIIGEVWEDASNKISYGTRKKYFLGDELDTVMNYPFKNAVVDFMQNKISADNFNNIIENILDHYPQQTHGILMNFLSTHDTSRIISALCGAPPMSKIEAANYKIPQQILSTVILKCKICVCIQFTLPGMPCIYYGDEIAMQGLFDPLNREYFKWSYLEENPISKNMYSFYKEITALRKKYKALSEGTFSAIRSLNKNLLIYKRMYKNDIFYIVVNNSAHDIQMKCKADNIYNLGGFSRRNNYITLKNQSFTILYAQK